MKQILRKTGLIRPLLLMLVLLLGGGNVKTWAEPVTGVINFGPGTDTERTKIDKASTSGNDSRGYTWNITTEGTTSFTNNSGQIFSQIGSSSRPATSITFTTTLPASKTITAFSAKFGGFNGTAGTVTLKVGDTTVGTGSLNASTDVTVNATSSATGTVLTVTVTGISKGVKAYKIEYTISENDTPTPTTYNVNFDAGEGTFVASSDFANATNSVEAGTYTLPSATRDGYTFDGWVMGDADPVTGSYTVSSDVNFTAQYTEDNTGGGDTPTPSGDGRWELTTLSNLTASDIFVIVCNNGDNYALSNDNGTSSAPTATSVTITEDKITSAVADNLKWNISGNATDGYIFYPNGSTTTWLYCTNNNNGVRVGTNAAKTFTVDQGYLKHTGTSRYVGVYNSQDWRCYTEYTAANIENQTFSFYKYAEGVPDTRAVTTTTIDDDGISNTNVWAGTAAGQLTATVKVGVDAVPNASITWTGDNNEVATIDASGNVTLVAAGTVNFTATYAGDEGNKGSSATYNLIVVNQNLNADNYTWNLSEKSYSSATTDKVVWESLYAAMVVDKAEAGTNANNYLPTAYSSSRFYKNSLLSIRPAFGYKVTSIEFTATTDGFADALRSSTWTNAGTNNEESGTTVIVTPSDPTKAITAVMKANCGFSAVKITYETVSMEPITVHLNGSGYATFASTYAIDLTDAQANGYSAWQIKAINDNIITFERLTGKVSWNTGMLMKGEANSDITLTTALHGNSQSDNKLVGITEATAISAGEYYGLSGKTFVKVNAGTVPAGKALLPASLVTESAGVKAFTFVFNDLTTGVNAVDNGQWTMDNGAIFDLSGRRLSKPAKGINIINGKKVVVK